MFISPALAHGSNSDGTIGGMMPIVIVGVVVLFALYLIARSSWRKYRAKRKINAE